MELSPRERNLLILGGGILLPILLLRFLLIPLIDYKENLTKEIGKREQEIVKIRKIGEELFYFRSKQGGGARVPFAQQLDRILTEAQLKKRASQSTRSGGGASLQLEGVTLAEATYFIYQLEASRPPLDIQSLEMKPSLQNNKMLQLQLVLEGY